jgi:PIN domain nuclease of toxin-antitoxin system
LDTQVFLWVVQDQAKLSPKCIAAIRDPKTELFLSAASVWEIGIKMGLGKLSLPKPLSQVLREVQAIGLRSLPISWEHAQAVEGLPNIHKDPFDRLLIAQAQVEELAVLSSDKVFKEYKAKVLW